MSLLDSLPDEVALLIVGSGPAGMAAAIEASTIGLDTLVVDENVAPGGQIYRAVDSNRFSDRAKFDQDFVHGKALAKQFAYCSARRAFETTVWSIERDDETASFLVGLANGEAARIIMARNVILATGAMERPFPIPGWTLPGVMTAGAAQILLKSSAVVPQGPLVMAGNGPLLMYLAAQYARIGVPIAALLDTTPSSNWVRAFPSMPAFLNSTYAWKGLKLLAAVRRHTRVISGVTELEAVGDGAVSAVKFIAGGRPQGIPVATLLLHQGVVPQVNLAMAAGCKHRWNDARACFEPVIGELCESELRGLFIAGDGAGIGGARAAECLGQLAALGAAKRLEKATGTSVPAIRKVLRRALRGRGFLDVLYRPADRFRIPQDNVVVCRCEGVTAGSIRAVTKRGAQGPNQTKIFLRSGMGPCQGRLCGLTVTEIMAATGERSADAIGYYHLRNPVKPIELGALAGLCIKEPSCDRQRSAS